MTPIETNKPLFFDTDGSPLEGGLIYIGQPSTDPRTNPKTVTFRDSGGSEFTAKQPLNTKAGRIVYNGLPIVSLVDGEYSMLIINANGQQVDYSRSVNSTTDGGGGIADFSEVTRVGLTLSEVKAFDVSVGEVVRNIGKTTATDAEGNEWLAVSATGSPADDVTLIDFTNGLQGQVVRPNYQEDTVTIDGDFDASQQIKVVRMGSSITISGVQSFFTHAGSANPVTSSGIIPEWARPASGQVGAVYFYSGPQKVACFAYVTSSGVFGISYNRTDVVSTFSSTATFVRPAMSYTV